MFGAKKEDELKFNMRRFADILDTNIATLEKLDKRVSQLETIVAVGNISSREGKFVSTISGFDSEEDFNKLVGIVEKITESDGSFTCGNDKEKMEVYLYCKTKDEAMQKSMWFWSKTGIENIKFNVKQSDK